MSNNQKSNIFGVWRCALLAQLVERKAVNLKVIGSNPIQSGYMFN